MVKKGNYQFKWWILIGLVLLVLPAGIALASYPGDLDDDGNVDMRDLKMFTDEWLVESCDANSHLYGGCQVNFEDYAIFAKDWMKSLAEFMGITYYVATDGNDSDPGT